MIVFYYNCEYVFIFDWCYVNLMKRYIYEKEYVMCYCDYFGLCDICIGECDSNGRWSFVF